MNVHRMTFDTPGLRDEWNRLLETSDPEAVTFFQTWEWNAAWWRTYGKSDPRRELWLLLLEEGTRAMAIAPLFRQIRSIGPRHVWSRLRWIGHELSPYPEIILGTASASAVWDAIGAEATRHPDEMWFELRDIGSRHSINQCPREGWRIVREEHDPVLQWEIPANSEERGSVLERVRPQFRRNIRKALGTFESHGSLTWQFRRGADRQALQALEELNLRRFHRKSFFTEPVNLEFHRALADTAHDMLFSATVSEGGRIIHVLYGFDYGNVLYYFLAGMDETKLALQPGIMNFYFTLSHALEHGYRRFDFLRGTERYKYDLGARPHNRFRWSVVPESASRVFDTANRIRNIRNMVKR